MKWSALAGHAASAKAALNGTPSRYFRVYVSRGLSSEDQCEVLSDLKYQVSAGVRAWKAVLPTRMDHQRPRMQKPGCPPRRSISSPEIRRVKVGRKAIVVWHGGSRSARHVWSGQQPKFFWHFFGPSTASDRPRWFSMGVVFTEGSRQDGSGQHQSFIKKDCSRPTPIRIFEP